ncbi:EAL and GGDEF domain-containing protein [Thiomicrospira microaerophila]|uniref:GGDEF domain-containing protein n=1 Tax=Thiomicrospira microaerophila TaxID=406020 RepID=UPI0020108D3A|nr:bifunctional diguanylate cyclase/phosphodiesterase [Thiomicrospira microaerophila]UQB43128.1 EAL and GGDEF domain-containing protein [Thiomicrospira microaerophila]
MNIESNVLYLSGLEKPFENRALTLKNELQFIFDHHLVTPLFQPIVDLKNRRVFAHEALIRGPDNSALHHPLKLFEAADQCGMLFEMDWLARSVAINEFQHQQADDFLFINVTVNSLMTENHRQGMTLDCLENSGLPLNRVVIEITELQPVHNFKLFIDSVNHYRQMGFKVALDDLGGGYNGLRLWSELRPDFVKIDKHFITGISQDTEKRHFLQTIKVLAEGLDTQLIAEGIETLEDLKAVEQIGINFVQGYFFRRPEKIISDQLYYQWQDHPIQPKQAKMNLTDLSTLLLTLESVESSTSVKYVANLFLNQQELDFIPIVNKGKVQGMIWRRELMDKLARRYGQELHHRKSIAYLMDPAPIIVEVTTPVENLSRQITDGNHHQNGDAFIITQNGNYLGCGRFIDLLRLITDLKVQNAQYANPLSGLPGNVPIQRYLQEQLDLRQGFSVIYVDADHFKPYNDFYSYDQGDEIIKQLSQILRIACEKTQSFIGHIGGDDFMIIIENTEDYQEICQSILNQFNQVIRDFYHPEDLEQGGIMTTNRQGHAEFFPMMSLSLGVLVVPPGLVAHKQKIAGLATKAKKQAKQAGGNTWSVIKAEQDNLPAIQNSKNGVK